MLKFVRKLTGIIDWPFRASIANSQLPIRAKMAVTSETSDYTSIQRRINSAIKGKQPKELLPFVGNERLNMPNGLMFSVKDYIVLVEDTGRIIRQDKRGCH